MIKSKTKNLGIKQEREQGIKTVINAMRTVHATDEQIITALMTEYNLSHEEAQERI